MIGKRSVSKINGETVSNAQLKEVAGILIDIHGQHEHQSLLYKKNHLNILDTYAKDSVNDIKAQVANAYAVYRKYKEELEHANLDEKERNKEMSFLEFEINEIQSANLKENEDDILEDAYRRMVNGKKITGNLEEAYGYTAQGNSNASEALSRAIHCLQDASRYDEKASELFEQLSEVDSLLNDFNRELSAYSESFEFSEDEFYEVESRLNEINRLKSKYGNTISEILTYCTEREETLNRLKEYDLYLENLRSRLKESEDTYLKYAKELSIRRKEAANELAKKIKDGLLELNFLDVQFEIVFQELADYSMLGIDDIEFMISMNPGENVKSLADVASGGELSRIMLAIKTVMAERDAIETLIFDEIKWHFSYSDDFKSQDRISPLANFPAIDKEYSTNELWPFFASRIPSNAQLQIDNPQDDIVKLLRDYGRKTVSNPFELLPA
jgi:DNA repair protein RecN (Recombination protein N)